MNPITDQQALLSDTLRARMQQLTETDRPRFRRLWLYHRNPMTTVSVDGDESGRTRPYRQAQEWGLPSRLTGARSSASSETPVPLNDTQRKEIVIENDIGWRIDAMVDCLFGKPVVINSTLADPDRRGMIESLLRQILSRHGGAVFLQQIALTGCVYGFVDVLVKVETDQLKAAIAPTDAGNDSRSAWLARLAESIRFEIVDPTRALPIASPTDYRQIEAYGQVYDLPTEGAPRASWLDRLLSRTGHRWNPRYQSADRSTRVDLITASRWERYTDGRLSDSGRNSLGRIPLVHVQNIPLPNQYAGGSEVEPLIPLQDELNTRLSDRANRITLQSFRMYLGKGVEQFTEMPIAPGRMWMTDNEKAEIIEFGGDSDCPSENAHVGELREAMDKTSGVTPIAAGAIRGRIGNLTSAAALKITLMALISRTEKKRLAYGAGLARMCELALAWLDCAGAFPTTPEERGIEIHWPDPLPQNDAEQLQQAEAKLRIGVPQGVVLKELGYDPADSGKNLRRQQ